MKLKQGSWFSKAAIAVLSLLGLLTIIPTAYAVNPTIIQMSGGFGTNITSVASSLNSVTQGDSLLVVEYAGTNFPNSCGFLLKPNDTLANNFVGFSCVTDPAGASMIVWYVPSSGPAGSSADTVNCRWTANNLVESCYVIQARNGGTISALASGVGQGNIMGVSSFATTTGSLVFEFAGMETKCQSVGVFGTVNPIPSFFNPANECWTSPLDNTITYGLSGSYHTTNGGLDGWSMITNNNQPWMVEAIQIAPGVPPPSTSTSFSGTQIGWLAPDSAHLNNALVLISAPLAGLVMPAIILKKLNVKGDTAVTVCLVGLAIGALVADLPASTAGVNQVPFAFTVVAVLLAVLYWWNT